MSGSWSSRLLWAALLTPPLLLLALAGAVSVWPQQIIGLSERATSLLSSGPPPLQHRRPMPMHEPPGPAPAPTMQIRGMVRKPDGSPYVGPYSIGGVHCRAFRFGYRGRYNSASFIRDSGGRDPSFLVQPQNDLNWIIIDAPEYAPGLVGPIASEDLMPDAPPVDVVLQKGFPHRVRVLDAEGAPIALAAVRAALTISPPSNRPPAGPDEEKGTDTIAGPLTTAILTDEDGWAVFPQVRADTDYEFAVTVYSCMIPDDTVFVRPKPGVDTVVSLPRSSATGVAVDEEGRPEANAVVLIASEFDERNGQETIHPNERIIASMTDAQGKFRIPHLHKDSAYLIRVEGADESRGYHGDVRASDPEIRVELLRRRIVRGLLAANRRATVAVGYGIPTGFQGRRYESEVMQWSEAPRIGTDGRFEFPVWDPSHVELKIGNQPVAIPWPPPSEPIEFEVPEPLDEPTERTVRLRVEAQGTEQPVDGTMTLYLINGPPERALQTVPRLVEVRNGAATFSCLRDEAFRYDVAAIPGYCTIPGKVLPALGDFTPVVAVHTMRAGPIRGRVVETDGSPAGPGLKVTIASAGTKVSPLLSQATDGALGVQTTETSPSEAPSPAREAPESGQPPGSLDEAASPKQTSAPGFPPEAATTTDAEGRFVINAWPIDLPGRLTVTRGCSERIVAPVQVGSSGQVAEIKVELPRTTTAQVRLLDPDGRPLPGGHLSVSLAHNHGGRSWLAGTTDADGRAVVDGLAEGEQGYHLRVAFKADYRRINVPLKPGGPPLELKAERGRVIEGKLTEAVTGWPIPKAYITMESTSGELEAVRAQTDDDGEFRVSTLPEGTYEVRYGPVFNALHTPVTWPLVEAGSGRPVEIRAANLNQLHLHPKRPSRP